MLGLWIFCLSGNLVAFQYSSSVIVIFVVFSAILFRDALFTSLHFFFPECNLSANEETKRTIKS